MADDAGSISFACGTTLLGLLACIGATFGAAGFAIAARVEVAWAEAVFGATGFAAIGLLATALAATGLGAVGRAALAVLVPVPLTADAAAEFVALSTAGLTTAVFPLTLPFDVGLVPAFDGARAGEGAARAAALVRVADFAAPAPFA